MVQTWKLGDGSWLHWRNCCQPCNKSTLTSIDYTVWVLVVRHDWSDLAAAAGLCKLPLFPPRAQFSFLAMPHGLWAISSLIRDRTMPPQLEGGVGFRWRSATTSPPQWARGSWRCPVIGEHNNSVMAFPALHTVPTLAYVVLSAFYFLCLPAAMTTLVFLCPFSVSYYFFSRFSELP